jgi:DNA polymerase (family X)
MDDVPFKPRAYEKAARSIEALEEDVEDIYKAGGIRALEDIPSIGKGIAQKIEELIKTGSLEYYQNLKKKVPVDLDSLSAIEGLGPKLRFFGRSSGSGILLISRRLVCLTKFPN